MANDILNLGGVIALLVLTVACGGLFLDNVALRASVKTLQKDKDTLQDRLNAAEARQQAMLDVLKFVMQGEIRTARNDEREGIFAKALQELNRIERDINISTFTGGQVGQAAQGRSNRQETSGE